MVGMVLGCRTMMAKSIPTRVAEPGLSAWSAYVASGQGTVVPSLVYSLDL